MQRIVENFFDTGKLGRLDGARKDIDNYAGLECYMGYGKDAEACASISVIFNIDGVHHILSYHYIPDAEHGGEINLKRILGDIISICRVVKVRKFIADPWSASDMMARVRELAADTHELRMFARNISPLMIALKEGVDGLRMLHRGEGPTLDAITNVSVNESRHGDFFPRKPNASVSISPLVSILMALEGWSARDKIDPFTYIKH